MLDQNRQENIKKFIDLAQEVPFVDQGREFSGWDCAGLVLCGYRHCAGIELPDLAGVSALDEVRAAAVFAHFRQFWVEIKPGQERPLDVAQFRRGRHECHVGLVVARGRVLHVEPELNATFVEPFDRGLLKSRLVGIYRHVQFAGPA